VNEIRAEKEINRLAGPFLKNIENGKKFLTRDHIYNRRDPKFYYYLPPLIPEEINLYFKDDGSYAKKYWDVRFGVRKNGT
jgi:hypothetical protein